jgi:hypothetical protein
MFLTHSIGQLAPNNLLYVRQRSLGEVQPGLSLLRGLFFGGLFHGRKVTRSGAAVNLG